MKKVLKYLVLFTLVITMTAGMTGCTTDSSEIKDTLEEFEYACNNMDVDAILKCIDPDISDPIRIGMAVVSTFTDTDYEDLVDGIFDNLGSMEFGSSFNVQDFLDTIEITDVKLKKKGKSATVTCNINFELAGEQFKRDASIDMVEKDDKWYISGIDMFSSDDED